MNKRETQILTKAIKDIENWSGSAYQQGDEVDVALSHIKMMVSVSKHGVCTEVCPHCDHMCTLDEPFKSCPKCKKLVVACSMCDASGTACQECQEGSEFYLDLFKKRN